MSKAKIKLNSAGVRELLKSAEMQAISVEHAAAILNRCGDGYETNTFKGKNRVNSMVFASTHKAKEDNLQNNTILKAIK
ncbi:MAG: hypothetical protein ACK5L3_14770 [Oscillospiraceae bacterium]